MLASSAVRSVRNVAALATTGIALTLIAAGSGSARPAAPLTQTELSSILAQAVQLQQVPSNLRPSLSTASRDVSLAWRDGCLVGHGGTTMPKPCVFGDRRSHTTVVLFGDSHSAAWFAGINVVSKQEHWRLVFMGKIGCPTISDVLVRRKDGVWYRSCVRWRHNMERRIIKLHPRLLVITSSEYVHHAQPDSGAFNRRHDKTFLNGVATMFRAVRHAAGRVAFIANTPRLMQPAFRCLRAHRSDVPACTVALNQAFEYPQVRQQEFQIAASDGITAIDPTSWFCTATRCPVIADDILIYRDSQHITPEWSEFLAPMLAGALSPLLRPSVGS